MEYINCEQFAKEILDGVKQVKHDKYFAIVSVGDNPASQSYIKGKIKDCEYCGIPYVHHHISVTNDELAKRELEETLYLLEHNDNVSAMILQLPLPDGWDEKYYINLIPSHKDVDGLTSNSKFHPCTPEGIVHILKCGCDLEGKNVLIIGRGNLVGRPLFDLLLAENCTITMAHSKTKNLESMLKSYDIIVVAAGKPNLIDLSKCDAYTVIDVGVNRVDGKLCGDCYNFNEELYGDNMWVTPVPKGIGLMTRAMLMKHIAEINCKGVKT